MINPSTTTITSESSETTTVTSRSGLTSVGLGGVVFKPPGYVPPLTIPEPVTVSTPTSPVAPTDFSQSTPSVEGNLIAVLNEKVINAFKNENVYYLFLFHCKLSNVWFLGETIRVYCSIAKQFT